MFSEYRGIPDQAKLLIYLSFIPNVAIGFIYTDLSYFLPNVQGLAPTLTGVVGSAMGITLVALSIPLGILADRHGRRKMLLLGNVCASLSLIGFALTTNFALYLVIAFLEGTGEAAYAVSVSALIADKAGDQKRTAAFSLLAFLGWIAGALGGFIISSVLALQGLGLDASEAHVVLYVVVGLLNLSITPLLFKITESPVSHVRKGILPRKSGDVLKKYIGYSITIAIGAGLFVPLMSFWFFKAYAVTDAVSGPVLGVTNLLTAAVVFMSPRLARKFGLVKATVITQASSMAFMVAIPSSPTFAVAASLYLVRVFLMNLSNPLTQSLIMGLVSPEERGMASGITASLWRLPNSLSQIAGYYLIGLGLLALPFYIATGLYAVGISVFWFVFKDARLPEEAKPQVPVQSSSLAGPEAER
ncbi:MAG: MFS transporter [Nitrososphaerota archaeon]|nr:MFS transporter [Nitrososphaerota archaeon]